MIKSPGTISDLILTTHIEVKLIYSLKCVRWLKKLPYFDKACDIKVVFTKIDYHFLSNVVVGKNKYFKTNISV